MCIFLFQEFWSAKKDIKRKSEKGRQSATSEHLQRLTYPCVLSNKILRTLYSLWSTSHSKDYQAGKDIYDQGKMHGPYLIENKLNFFLGPQKLLQSYYVMDVFLFLFSIFRHNANHNSSSIWSILLIFKHKDPWPRKKV